MHQEISCLQASSDLDCGSHWSGLRRILLPCGGPAGADTCVSLAIIPADALFCRLCCQHTCPSLAQICLAIRASLEWLLDHPFCSEFRRRACCLLHSLFPHDMVDGDAGESLVSGSASRFDFWLLHGCIEGGQNARCLTNASIRPLVFISSITPISRCTELGLFYVQSRKQCYHAPLWQLHSSLRDAVAMKVCAWRHITRDAMMIWRG